MLLIEGKTIKFSRGDDVTINFSCKDKQTKELYEFQQGDTIQFRIFTVQGYGKEAILSKEITVDEPTTTVLINLTSQETKLGEESNTSQLYWYEISINEDNTVIGFDNAGPAKLYVLPAREES